MSLLTRIVSVGVLSFSSLALNAQRGPVGPIGPQGISGIKGDTGDTGPAGPRGANGPKGDTGDAGPQGVQGVQGLAGPRGAVGPIGPAGPGGNGSGSNGVTPTISIGTVTTGSAGSNAVITDVGSAPNSIFNFTIPRGAMGATGPQGTQGATGPQGPAGSGSGSGLNFRGAWSGSTTYAVGDVVSYLGSSYGAITASNINHTPSTDTTDWAILAQKGDTGATGTTGSTGAAGSAGLGLTFKSAWSSSVGYAVNDITTFNGSSYVATASIGIGSVDPTQDNRWSLVAQKGNTGTTGTTGLTGSAGTAATITIGTTSTGAANVTNSGTSTAAVLNFTVPQGIKGDTGTTGASGTAATITVGTVTTGAAGSSVLVTNTGTTTAAVLNFTIPQGVAGSGGSGSGTNPTVNGVQTWNGSAWVATTYSDLQTLLAADTVNNSLFGFHAGSGGDATCHIPLTGQDYLCYKGGGIQKSHNGGDYAPAFAWSCQPGLGGAPDAIQTGTYVETVCRNETGETVTLSTIKCHADTGASTCAVTNGAGTALTTGVITGSSSYASGTQSATTTLAPGDNLVITFVADGTTKDLGIDVSGSY